MVWEVKRSGRPNGQGGQMVGEVKLSGRSNDQGGQMVGMSLLVLQYASVDKLCFELD